MIIVTVTVLLLYLSAAVLESEKKLDGAIYNSNSNSTNKINSPKWIVFGGHFIAIIGQLYFVRMIVEW